MSPSPKQHLSARPRRSVFLFALALCALVMVSIVSGTGTAALLQLPIADLARATVSKILVSRTAPAFSPVSPVPLPAGPTDPTPQSLPYTQAFAGLAASSTTYPAGWQGWNLSLGGAGASFRTTAPVDDDALIASSGASISTGGVHNYNGKIGFLQNGSNNDASIALAINTTGGSNIKVAYDMATIRNPYDGTTNTRINEATLQYRVGTSGSFSSLTGIEYQNNTTTQTGSGVTTPQNPQPKAIFLPAACNNQSVVELRWTARDVSGGGSRPSFAVDNVSIQATQTIGGQVLTTGGAGSIGANKTVTLLRNGIVVGSDDTDVNGDYLIPGMTLASGDKLAVFLDDETEKGATVTLFGPSDITNLNIIQNQLIVRSDNGSSITNAILGAAQGITPDADLTAVYTVAGSNLTTPAGVALQIWLSSTYQPLGDITDGGDWTNNGSFSAGSNTVTFNSGAGNQKIGGTNNSFFDHLTVNNVPVNPTPSTNNIVSLAVNTTVTTALNVTAGVFNQGASGSDEFDVTTNSVTVGANGTWQNLGKGDVTLTGNVSNAGQIIFNANGTPCGGNDDILIRSLPDGTKRTWSGAGTFSMTDVDVKDQKVPGFPTLPLQIIVNSGNDPVPGSNTGWTFTNTCSGPYTWIANGTNQDWQLASNWSPVRPSAVANSLVTTDELIFNSDVTPAPTISNVPTQTIATLHLVNGPTNGPGSVMLNAATTPTTTQTLTITGATSNDLAVPAGASLYFQGTGGVLKIQVGSSSTAKIDGNVILQDKPHRILGGGANTVLFQTGSSFATSGAGFTGNPFGDGGAGGGTLGSIIFRDGSTANFDGGCTSPFGAAAPNSVVDFQSGSTQHLYVASAFDSSGRSYGNLILDGGGVYDAGGSGELLCQNNLTIGSGSKLTLSPTAGGNLIVNGNFTNSGTFDAKTRTVKFQGGGATQNLSGTLTFFDVLINKSGGSVKVGGDLNINGVLQFNGATDVLDIANHNVNLNGTVSGSGALDSTVYGSDLHIGGTGALTSALAPLRYLGTQPLGFLTVDRTSNGSVTFATNVTVGNASSGGLDLKNGVVDMGANTLSLASFPQITRTNGYVIGNLQKTFGATGLFTFTVGTSNAYSPVDANVTVNSGGSLTVKAVQGKQPNISGTNALQRYWTLSGSGLTASLTFYYRGGLPTGGDVVGDESLYKVFKYNSGFSQPPNQSVNTGAHTATVTGVTSFSDWTLAERDLICPSITLSPATLPVGWVGAAYNNPISVSGGGPYTFTTTGTLPTGLTLNSDGTWSGMPSAAGTFNFTVTATDGSGCEGSQAYSVKISTCQTAFLVDDENDTDDANASTSPDGLCADATGKCTLRAAIQEANADSSCGLININFDPVVFSSPHSIVLGSELPAIQHNVNINGTGAGLLKVSGDFSYRVFKINSGYTVKISDLTINHGYSGDEDGGGVLNEGGAVTLKNCVVIDNSSDAEGGGIYSSSGSLTLDKCTINFNTATSGDGGGIYNSDSSTLVVTTSTISGNTAQSSGGGIFNSNGSDATMTNSTVSGNGATDGGGISNDANLKIFNSTISGNTADNSGGGIYDGGTLALVNVTISDNHCDNDTDTEGEGGGLEAVGGSANSRTLRNTIVAGNFTGSDVFTLGPGPAPDNIRGTAVSGSSNLIGPGGDGGLSPGSNQLNVANPKLAPLGNYGGPTQTHALLAGSPAIDAGENCVVDDLCSPPYGVSLTYDQRGPGFLRQLDGDGDSTATVDIGAFELHYAAGAGPDFAVNTRDDHDDGACEFLSAGHDCTLREAINAANASSDANTIKFDIPDPGVQTITPLTPLPPVIYPVTIDGYTQHPCSSNPMPCSQPNADPTCNDALLLIELDGSMIYGFGLDIVAGASTVKGLVINRFVGAFTEGAGIRLSGNGGNTIQGNFIGTDASGTQAADPDGYPIGNEVGVKIDNCAGNIIGGAIPINAPPSSAAAARNLISANFEDGIQITGVNSSGNIIRGNFIGTDSSGTAIFDDSEDENPLGNGVGIEIYDGPNNIVGNSQFAGPALPGAGNVISGNYYIGVEISSGATAGPTGNGVGSNFIGTDLTGMLDLGNGGDGVQLCLDAHDNIIGGSTEEFRNVIAYNYDNGVNLLAPTLAGNAIRLNSIHDNGALGIDLGNDNVTDNDAGDGDNGANNKQNFPVIQSASINGNAITISGRLYSTPGQTFTIDFYANQSCNDDQPYNGGHGEGQSYIGSLVDVPGDDPLVFSGTMPLNAGSVITATATDAGGSTSEFSQCFPATIQNVALSVYKSAPSPDLAVDQESTYTITVTNSGNVAASSATVKEAIPAGVDLISTNGANWSCSPAAQNDPVGTITCAFSGGTIAASGGSSTIDIVVKPKSATAGATVTNKYSVDPSGGTGAPNPTTCTGANIPTSGCGQPVASQSCLSTLTVTDAGDAPDANTGDIVCETVTGNGVCTLRAAIEQANALSGCSNTITINFDIPGSGVHTITPGSPLPAIKHPLIINAYSQTGAAPNTALNLNNATLLIELSGAGAGVGVNGLVLDANYCTVKGLVINRFGGAGIKVLKRFGNEIIGNFIGTDTTGMLAVGGGNVPYGNDAGVLVLNGGASKIGCTFAEERNIISGNLDDGVQITGAEAAFNLVQGNFIGVQRDGVSPLGNGGAGVEIYEGGLTNMIGGQTPVEGGTERNRKEEVLGNRKLSSIAAGSGANQTPAPAGNMIAFNGEDGVLITSSPDIANRIVENSIYSNKGLGINLVGPNDHANGVTDNDAGDTDDGPNRLLNFPLITSVDVGSQTISGTLNSTAHTSDFTIEFFASPSCDPSGYGEGKKFIGSLFIPFPTQTDDNGDVPFSFTAPLASFGSGDVITATATDPSGNTSEFSPCAVILSVSKSQPSPSLVVGQDSTYTITVTNSGTAPATSATVKEAIPAGLDLISATGTDWSCVPAGPNSDPVGVVACMFSGSITPNGATTIGVKVKPKAGTAGQSITNKYSIDPAGGANAPDPTTCTAADAPTVGCGAWVVSTIGAAPCPTIVVNPTSLPNGVQGVSYSQTVTASGGVGSYSFSVTNGALPNGLSLSSGGVLDGTPSTPGTFTFTITATDSNNCAGSRAYTISICPSRFTVNSSSSDVGDANLGDGVCATGGGVCTLRAAIEEANALASCGTINIDFSIGSSTITLGGVQLTINHDVNINGPSANSVIVSGNNASRVFTVNSGKTVSISSLTISGGNGSGGDGGAIRNNGTLTLKGVTLSGNAAINGGAIRSDGPLVLANTTISGNSASSNGGALYNAIAQATLTNVTVAYNRADSDDSGAESGGGIFRVSGNVLLHNTIVADNFKRTSGAVADDIGGSVDSASSYNVVGTGSGLINGSGNNQVGVASALLGKLIDNGGPTFTHGLLYNSPALDAGDNAVTGSPLFLNVDQRGVTRPQPSGGTVDIGSYERQPTETRKAPDGPNAKVDINDVRLTFPCVPSGGCQTGRAKGGDTLQPNVQINTVDLSVVPVPGDAPNGSGPAFDVTPSSSFYAAPVSVCFYLPSITNPSTFANLRVFHRQTDPSCPTAQPCLVDNGSVPDFPSKTVCTSVTSFSQFVINQAAVPTATNGNVSGQIVDNFGNPVEGAAVRMSGTQNRLTVTDADGHYNFDEVETNGFYTVTPSRANFVFSPSQRSFSALGQHTEAAFNASPTGNGLNPLDATAYFVRQQYLDFLNREPDEAGFNFWVNNIESCGADQNCRSVKQIDTSAAFFLSIEFQQTGYLVYRTYQAAYGDPPGAPVPINLSEFKPDTAEIGNGVVVNKTGWEAVLENNKRAFMAKFAQRPRFTSAYPTTMTPAEFVDKLFLNAGVNPSANDRNAAINEFGGSPTSSDVAARARALWRAAENSDLARQEFNQAFVLMQYFGYLRRDANTGPDSDFTGYDFWLQKLNAFNGNFGDAEMVKAFLLSGEYRGRFPR